MNEKTRSRDSRGATLAAVVATLGIALSPAALGAQRTFVMSTGFDTNSCSIAAPCRSFGTALTHTDPAGEIIVLDSAGYGSVTIAQSVSIIAPPGIYAGISVFPTFDGVVVNGSGVIVTLKGLTINGQGGNDGISFLQGTSLAIEDCTVTGMGAHGIFASAANSALSITDSIVRGSGSRGVNATGTMRVSIVRSRAEANSAEGFNVEDGVTASISDSVAINNGFAGIRAQANIAATTQLTVDRVESHRNTAGVLGNPPNAGGLVNVHVTRSNLSHNSVAGFQLSSAGGTGTATGSITDSLVANNGNTGVSMFPPPGAAAAGWRLTVGGNRIVDTPGTGIFVTGPTLGTLFTRTDNTVSGNGVPSSGPLTTLTGL